MSSSWFSRFPLQSLRSGHKGWCWMIWNLTAPAESSFGAIGHFQRHWCLCLNLFAISCLRSTAAEMKLLLRLHRSGRALKNWGTCSNISNGISQFSLVSNLNAFPRRLCESLFENSLALQKITSETIITIVWCLHNRVWKSQNHKEFVRNVPSTIYGNENKFHLLMGLLPYAAYYLPKFWWQVALRNPRILLFGASFFSSGDICIWTWISNDARK